MSDTTYSGRRIDTITISALLQRILRLEAENKALANKIRAIEEKVDYPVLVYNRDTYLGLGEVPLTCDMEYPILPCDEL